MRAFGLPAIRALAAAQLAALALATAAAAGPLPRVHLPDPRERHFSLLTMLTDGGENAEAYFSYDSQRLIFQSTRPPHACDQIMIMPAGGGNPELLSSGEGRTTCAYFTADGRSIVYATTSLAGPGCPTPPDMSQGYVWGVFGDYDIVKQDLKTGAMTRLTDTPGYDAEATISPDGKRMVFTSVRDGDLDIYTMDLDGGDVRRLTTTPGYDGGAFFSPDGKKICYRCLHPEPGPALDDYRALLAQDKVRPSLMEIWVMNADGTGQRQVTDLKSASFGPFFHPDGKRIIFSSNYPEPKGREFELWMVGDDGAGLERVTYAEGFDGFPMWAPDGETFVFCSNRHHSGPRETNVFVTKWVD